MLKGLDAVGTVLLTPATTTSRSGMYPDELRWQKTIEARHAAGHLWAQDLLESLSTNHDATTRVLANEPDRLEAAAGVVAEIVYVDWMNSNEPPLTLKSENFADLLTEPSWLSGHPHVDPGLPGVKDWLVRLHMAMVADWNVIDRIAIDLLAKDEDEELSLYRWARKRGYVVAGIQVALERGRSRPGWLVYDLGKQAFVEQAVNWTSTSELERFIAESSG